MKIIFYPRSHAVVMKVFMMHAWNLWALRNRSKFNVYIAGLSQETAEGILPNSVILPLKSPVQCI